MAAVKAGGVKVVKTAREVQETAAALLGKTLVTYQNAPDGQPVNKVLVEETLPIARELCLSLLVDRTLERVVVVASETAALHTLSDAERKLLGAFEGLRGYRMLPEGSVSIRSANIGEVTGLMHSAQLSQVPLLPDDHLHESDLFPEGRLDQDLQQVDLRGRNSWRLLMAEVSSVELLEVQLVNAVAPFIINARLKPLMLRTANRDKHIVNVSAVEGQFYRNQKTTRHPHTNMAKRRRST